MQLFYAFKYLPPLNILTKKIKKASEIVKELKIIKRINIKE
jgi:hypothetical protein